MKSLSCRFPNCRFPSLWMMGGIVALRCCRVRSSSFRLLLPLQTLSTHRTSGENLLGLLSPRDNGDDNQESIFVPKPTLTYLAAVETTTPGLILETKEVTVLKRCERAPCLAVLTPKLESRHAPVSTGQRWGLALARYPWVPQYISYCVELSMSLLHWRLISYRMVILARPNLTLKLRKGDLGGVVGNRTLARSTEYFVPTTLP
jgi:hypothetical protein